MILAFPTAYLKGKHFYNKTKSPRALSVWAPCFLLRTLLPFSLPISNQGAPVVSKQRLELCDLGKGTPFWAPVFSYLSGQLRLVSSTGVLLLSGLRSFEVQGSCSRLRPGSSLVGGTMEKGSLRTCCCLMGGHQARGE